jgi:peroxiredoxin
MTMLRNFEGIRRAFRTVSAIVLLGGCAATPAAAPAPTTAADPAGTPSVMVTSAMGSPHIGDDAPDFELTDQNGQPVRLSSYRGSVVVLAFVASFCPFSEAAQPHLAALADEYAKKGVRVVAVDVAEPEEEYKKYVARARTPFPVLHDKDGKVGLSFTPERALAGLKNRQLAVVTSNLVIDKEGHIRFFTLLDTTHFDAKLVHVRRAVDAALGS